MITDRKFVSASLPGSCSGYWMKLSETDRTIWINALNMTMLPFSCGMFFCYPIGYWSTMNITSAIYLAIPLKLA